LYLAKHCIRNVQLYLAEHCIRNVQLYLVEHCIRNLSDGTLYKKRTIVFGLTLY
jgi:hypothetical protein